MRHVQSSTQHVLLTVIDPTWLPAASVAGNLAGAVVSLEAERAGDRTDTGLEAATSQTWSRGQEERRGTARTAAPSAVLAWYNILRFLRSLHTTSYLAQVLCTDVTLSVHKQKAPSLTLSGGLQT